MGNHTKKQGEIKTWNKGKPNIVGGSGALGLIGGVAGKAVKMLNFANIRSAVKQYVRKRKKITTPGDAVRGHGRIQHVTKTKTKISKPKPKEIKYQKRYHENEILEQPSGYYRSDAKGWPLPIDRKW